MHELCVRAKAEKRMRKYPTWEQFRVKNAENKTDAFETLCRFLFKAKYGVTEALPYAYNNAGNETVTNCNQLKLPNASR